MNIQLGTLIFSPALKRPELMAAPVARALAAMPGAEAVGACEIDPAFSDTAAFCERYEVAGNRVANCVVAQAKRGERSWFAACVILANTRADVNGLARRTLDARKVSFASMEQAVAQTGMEYGAITPVGLSPEWAVLIDKMAAGSECVIIGSGVRASKLAVPGTLLASLPNVQILEGLGQVKP